MTNYSKSEADKAIDQARQARNQAASAKKEADSLKKQINSVVSKGDPKKATTAQLITGEY